MMILSPLLKHSISAFSLVVSLAGSVHAAEPQASAAPDDAVADGGAIVVTGVRGARPRTVADSPVPIDVIDTRELQATGRVGLKDILGNIVPSLTVPALGGGGTSSGAKPISIRGLSGD